MEMELSRIIFVRRTSAGKPARDTGPQLVLLDEAGAVRGVCSIERQVGQPSLRSATPWAVNTCSFRDWSETGAQVPRSRSCYQANREPAVFDSMRISALRAKAAC
jgi:hypothetical protein